MKQAATLFFATLLLAACGGGDKLHFTQEGVAPKPEPDVSGEAFLARTWRHNLDGEFNAQTNRLYPALDDDQVVMAGPEGEVMAVEPATGEVRWQIELDSPVTGGIGSGDGLVMVSTINGAVIALDRNDGSESWRTTVGGEVLAPPVIAPGVAVVRAGDGKVVGLDTGNGQLLWSVQKSVEGLTVRGASRPLINGRGVVVGLADGRLMALDVDRGRVLWETPIGTRGGSSEVGRLADIDTDPALLGTVLYVASYQSRVVAMALGTPRVIWSADISTLKNFGLDADRLYVTTETGSIAALNRYTGELVWEQDQLSGRGLTGPLAIGGHLLVGDFEGIVYRLDPANGAIRAAQDVARGAIVQAPIDMGGRVVVVSEDGRVQALDLLQ